MGRLIDANKLYEDLANDLSSIMGDGSDGKAIDTYVTIGDIIHGTFDEQPTAYDVDAVVEQSDNEFKIVKTDDELMWNRALDKAIEIVKGGGVDAKAVLVMDMPESCGECPFCRGLNACKLKKYLVKDKLFTIFTVDAQIMEGGKPSWCPLRELPNKEHNDNGYDEYSDGYDAGWNACLDEILK